MSHKEIPAIEQFLDEAEEWRLEYLKNLVDLAWDEMQTLNSFDIDTHKARVKELRDAKFPLMRKVEKRQEEIKKEHWAERRAITEPVYERAMEQNPDAGIWNFWDYCTKEEAKTLKAHDKKVDDLLKAVKVEMGYVALCDELKALKAIDVKELDAKVKNFRRRFPELTSGLIFYCTNKDEAYKWCFRQSRLFRESIKEDIFSRTRAYIGEMYDMEPTHLNAKLNLNGIAYGEKGKCKVWTIIAGGYNIQKRHYRCLVKNI